MRAQVELICDGCQNVFSKDKSSYDRNVRLGRLNYCSLSCVAQHQFKKNYESFLNKAKPFHFKKGQVSLTKGGTKDTPYLYYIKKAKSRNHECNIDSDYLDLIWKKQKGKCVFTGLNMQLKTHTTTAKDLGLTCASLDRIDSSKGYIIGNVQFICVGLNLAKGNRSDSELKEWLRIIKHGSSEYNYVKSEIVEKMEQLVPF